MAPTIALVPATRADHPVFQNMGRLYVYDMSRYCGHLPGWELPEDGLYECMDFAPYFESVDVHPFFVHVDGVIGGFVVVERFPDIDGWTMEQFFVLARFQRLGVGARVAAEVWRRFPGPWCVEVIPENRRAYLFWKHAVERVAGGVYRDAVEDRIYEGVRTERNVFRFATGS